MKAKNNSYQDKKRIQSDKYSKNNSPTNKFNIKFIMLNIITFGYVFFIFCNLSYEIYKLEKPIFFLYLISICFFTDIGGYTFGKIIGGKAHAIQMMLPGIRLRKNTIKTIKNTIWAKIDY